MNHKKIFRIFSCLIAIAALTVPAMAIERDAHGTYLIGSTADYEEFCDLVKAGDPYASARVTADIKVTRSIGEGTYEYHYRGKFDGQGHTLTIAFADAGVFAHTHAGCEIRNVNVTGWATNSAALVTNAVATTIENCSSDCVVDGCGAENMGGLVGNARGVITMTNCSFTGMFSNVTGQGNALIGWIQHTAHISGCHAEGNFALAGNLVEGTNFVDNTTLNGNEVYMTVEAPSGGGIPYQGVNYRFKELEGGRYGFELLNCNSGIKAIKVPSVIHYGDEDIPVVGIGYNSMSYRKLEHLEVPASVTRIENDAFDLSEALSEVIFDDSDNKLWLGRNTDATLGQELFYNCPIQKVYIGRNLAWDGSGLNDEPFESRETLREITFGPRVTLVGNYDEPDCTNDELFNDCTKATHYAFLGDEQSLGTSLKFFCAEGMSHAANGYINRDLEESSYTEYSVITGYGISDKTEHVTYGPFVTYVTPKIFSGIGATTNGSLTTADFTNAVRLKSIKTRAFADCDELKEVNLVNTQVTEIESEGFYDCDKLEKVVFSNVIEKIGRSAFDDCALTEVLLPKTITTLGYKAFYDCDELTKLSLSPGEGEIYCEDDGGECRTFDSCSNLTYLYMGRDISYKEGQEKGSPFYDSYFTHVVIDNGVTKLGQYMFQHSNKLKMVDIGSGITKIPDNCFNETVEVTKFNLVDGEKPLTLGNSCRSFKVEQLYIGRKLNDPENIPMGEKAMKILQYGPHAKVVKTGLYKDMPNLKNVILPADAVVEHKAFVNCDIEQLYVQGDATFESEAFSNCDWFFEITVVGKLTAAEKAIAPSDNAVRVLKNLNVFFKEDPKDESHADAFPQKFLDETEFNNLFETPYQKVEFTCMPWIGFKKRNTYNANDYSPTTEVMENGKYDHAYISNKHDADKYFSLLMPFDVSTYYFGSDAKAYDFAKGSSFTKSEFGNNITLTTASKSDLDSKHYFTTNMPYIIKSSYSDEMVGGAIDQFKSSQIYVDFHAREYAGYCELPYYVSGKDEVINPGMGNYYVIDNGCLKRVNNDYTLRAFSVAFNAGEGNKMHFVDKETGKALMPESVDATASSDFMGYMTFYCDESSYHAEGAEVFTVTEELVEGVPTLVLNSVKDDIVSQGQGVLIKHKPGETLTMTMVTSPSSDEKAYEYNVLKGVESDTPVSDLPGNIFVLGKNQNVVGFYAMGNSAEEGMFPAHHAYISSYDVDPSTLPAVVDIDTHSAIDDINTDNGKESPIYDINGRRVYNPERNNIYIKDGQKIIQK